MIKELPKVGYGTWAAGDKEVLKKNLDSALNHSKYTHIDTAQMYNNEYNIGEVLKELHINREELFITTKITHLNYKYYVRTSTLESLRRLQTDYIDLMLLHVSVKQLNVNAYKELMKLRGEGLVKHIGVSNFSIEDLKEIKDTTGEFPYANQIVCTPKNRAVELENFCKENSIRLIAYSTIKAYYTPNPFYPDAAMTDGEKSQVNKMGEKYGKSPAQVLLRWTLQLGYHIIPKSSSPERIKQNISLCDFELTNEEMETINKMNHFTSEMYASIVGGWGMMMNDELSKRGLLFEKMFDQEILNAMFKEAAAKLSSK